MKNAQRELEYNRKHPAVHWPGGREGGGRGRENEGEKALHRGGGGWWWGREEEVGKGEEVGEGEREREEEERRRRRLSERIGKENVI